ncbi:hypothetical protein HU200_039492 [Digitaria exilis]|uniref:DUF4220 domain-containing protein n=1 Tax=Digitaria exilis TaxID=1010633 RepID=A0A835BA66_9POAL|nr:hypothetical protein HU200_039492 [Digitaria exilis]CAB3452794.1 unnamed protein product [Digitaria exilis]
MSRGLLNLWNHWSIQILVLLSLALQLFLFAFAGIRRRGANPVLRFLLWLAYLLADSTAIFALGHISLSATTREHRLVPFWAPFLLLHLGGPDNLSAYALQDNQLWLRHLQMLIVQVLGAAYVLYKHIAANGVLVLVATALMFAVGFLKYAERTWALRCGNLSSIRSSINKEPPTRHGHVHPHDDKAAAGEMIEESALRQAHSLFHICKRAIVDSSVEGGWHDNYDIKERLRPLHVIIWALMEMELSLMYDILYTKAAVIHTWFGYCIRLFSPLATAASLVLFHFSGEDGYSGVDVIITYVLLGGALFMETTSLVNALGSTWAFAFLCTTRWSWLKYEALCKGRWDRLRRTVVSLHQIVKAAAGRGSNSYRSRRWSGTMGQYNMLHFCTRPDDNAWITPLLGRLAKMVGLREWWDRKHHSGSVQITELVKEHVVSHMEQLYLEGRWNTLGSIRKKWGQEALDRHRSSLEDRDYNALMVSLGVEFQEGIIIWHIGTDVFLANTKQAKEEGALARVEAIKLLSNYMMFLLVEQPDMLPGLAQNRLYQRTCKNVITLLRSTTPTSWRSMGLGKILQSLFRLHDNPSTSRATEREDLANILFAREPSFEIHAPRLSYVTGLARLLVKNVEVATDAVQLVLDVWTDLVVYAGNKCSRESHAKKLNSGGELTTILWLMAEHLFQADLELMAENRLSQASLENV